jgi:hypothetical protein
MILPPNALLPCPSDSARKRHAAHGELCPVCDADGGRQVACPDCGLPVALRGVLYGRHDDPTGLVCRRSGRLVVAPDHGAVVSC